MEDAGEGEKVAVPEMRPDSGGGMSPVINCRVCNRLQKVETRDWKLILSEEPFVCSKECVIEWVIQRQKSGPHLVGSEGMIYNPVLDPKKWFHSNFEERVFLFLEKNNILVHYEVYTFPVGNGFYTPDFYVPIAAAFLETKGRWGLGQKKKFRAFRQQYPGIPILIVPWTIQSEF